MQIFTYFLNLSILWIILWSGLITYIFSWWNLCYFAPVICLVIFWDWGQFHKDISDWCAVISLNFVIFSDVSSPISQE